MVDNLKEGLEQLPVAAIQMVSGSDIDENIERAEALICQAKQASQARLVVLPENAFCYGSKDYQNIASKQPQILERFKNLCIKQELSMVIGSIPCSSRPDGTQVDGRYRSACFAINADGELLGRYDKIHLFDVDIDDRAGSYRESDQFEPGGDSVVVTDDKLRASIGLSICYDLRFPALYQALRKRGANVIVVPAAFTKVTGEAHWEVLLRARAIETQCYIIAPNQGGQHDSKRETWGHSMIISPWGEILNQIDAGEGVCAYTLDLSSIEKVRRSMPVMSHQRIL